MRRFAALLLICALTSPLSFAADEVSLVGYAPRSSQTERDWENKFRDVPDPANLREYLKRMSARPHHVGSPYDKDNAEWILGGF
jgi:N-acetylated-alpha-linked acidic dipeptidase